MCPGIDVTLRVRATILQTPTWERLEVLEDQLINVADTGVITDIGPWSDDESEPDVVLPSTSVLLPGLIDTHLHAPQWPQRATGLDLPLERWLFEYTFPLEARYADADLARRVWESMVPELLAAGTTTVVYHCSVHEESTLALAETCIAHGQRAFVGRVAMDHPEGTPDWYRDRSAAVGVEASRASIEQIRALPGSSDLVQPIVTPRFVPACTDALLSGLGELAVAEGALVQTHCSESDWEHEYVIERYGRTDTQVLVDFGLAVDHSVLAHATHLTDGDRALLLEAGAGVAHCPLSNAYFASAVFPARRSLETGLRVGLGSDIAGGPEHSILAQCAHAVTASRVRETGVDHRIDPGQRGVPGSRIDVVAAFWMATRGGAELLGIPAGLLAPGRVFDAIAIDVGPESGVEVWSELDDWGRIFEKVVRGTRPTAIGPVWVGGRDVTPRT